MAITEDIRKTLSDPKPLYALAGVGDLAAEKIKDAPERLREAPTLIAEAGATLTTIANKIAAEAPERIAKATASVQGVASKSLHPDTEALRGAAQSVALQQVGRLLEAAGKAVETYDVLAQRGKVAVGRYTGGDESGEGAEAEQGPVKVVVEQVIDEDEITEEPAESAEEAARVFVEAAEAEEAAADAAVLAEAEAKAREARRAAAKPAAKKSAPRKRAAAPKTPRPPQA